jgi:hypothetical protein
MNSFNTRIQGKIEQLERARLAQERLYNDRLESLNRDIKRELEAIRKQLEDNTQSLKGPSSAQATVYEEKFCTVRHRIDGIDREMKEQFEAGRDELAGRTR